MFFLSPQRSKGGVVHFFEGATIVAHWNAFGSTALPQHCSHACAGVLQAYEAVSSLLPQWRGTSRGKPLRLLVGLSTGFAVCGHSGSTDTVRFVVLGQLWPLSRVLCQMNLDLGTGILVSGTVFDEAQFHYRLRSAAVVALPGLALTDPVSVFELRMEHMVRGDNDEKEWYVLSVDLRVLTVLSWFAA